MYLLVDHADGELFNALHSLVGDGDAQENLTQYMILYRHAIARELGGKTNLVEDFMTTHERLAQLERNSSRRDAQELKPARASANQYPGVYGAPQGGNILNMFGKKFALPADSTREDNGLYEEISIPAATPAAVKSGERLVEIANLDNLCRGCFGNYKALNRIQSLVYPVAYGTNENMLICAPTGAGKTDIALMAILNQLSAFASSVPNFEDSAPPLIDLNAFKIVYVAPMKALAAEIVEKLGRRLAHLHVRVRELTGDMQLTRDEISRTQIIVTTPEKWDVVTRKGATDSELGPKVKLLIMDEVHLLHDERGAVIESLVARTLRQVESRQSLIRIMGLSATLPNYLDVADFLRVNRYKGLFYFGESYRPIPLEKHFIGVKGKAGSRISQTNLDRACFDKVVRLVEDGHQVMVFVHARRETSKTARTLRDLALAEGSLESFSCRGHATFDALRKEASRARNKEIKELYDLGFGIHHAGLSRSDRNLTEKLFKEGVINVLCCTATLAWGVNLPAYSVIIKGTQIYDVQKGGFVDLGVLDVQQIFGRAGRPGYESRGVGYLCTTHDKLTHFVSALTQQSPIESRLADKLVDNLNAEIALGTVNNVQEGAQWLDYTYLVIRMRRNPFTYGLTGADVEDDPQLGNKRRELIRNAAKRLHELQMVVFNPQTDILITKELGRIASNFYLLHNTIEMVNLLMKPDMKFEEILGMVSNCTEFNDLKVRESEGVLLSQLAKSSPYSISGGLSSTAGKVNLLLQTSIENGYIEDVGLAMDANFVKDNAQRISAALFQIGLSRNWGPTALSLLSLRLAIEYHVWHFSHPLIDQRLGLPRDISRKLDSQMWSTSIDDMKEMDVKELGDLVHNQGMGKTLRNSVLHLPRLEMEITTAPLTRHVLRVNIKLYPDFEWFPKIHAPAEPFYIWVEDSENTGILYSEFIWISKRNFASGLEIDCTVPLTDHLPSQIYVRAVSDKWQGAETLTPVSFQHLILPELNPPQTQLLDLQPLPVSALQNATLEDIYSQKFLYFNPVQTQVFHTVYHSNENVLIGAPTGSGKTIAAELAMWAAFRESPKAKVIYIAPMKALVKERVADWGKRLMKPTNRKILELTGDSAPDSRDVQEADVIITTPEKWDGVSRNWKRKSFVQQASLIIIDEIHLLGGDRGPVLEVIVSRLNYIMAKTRQPVRIIGLSTAIANAQDLAGWLGIDKHGLFNFRHSVRPVPLEIYIDGFPDRGGYCARSNSMNKPAMAAIKIHSPEKPVLIFVSSRRQTRLTAQDLVNYCGMEDNPRRFLKMSESDLADVLGSVADPALRIALSFGIGLHHAGLNERDRRTSERLYLEGQIQVLVATSTLAWGLNFPAHLVIVKGTEFFDAKIQGYKDMELTDVLQMLGRAGRPGFDTSGVAMIFVKESKKSFYKHFLHSGFPVESALHKVLQDHINAEISSLSIDSLQGSLDYLSWTFFFRRVHQNPTYYGVEESSAEAINRYLSELIKETVKELLASQCIIAHGESLSPTKLGKIASFYYISHRTVRNFCAKITSNFKFKDCLQLLCEATEFDELPVRHNEDLINAKLAESLPFGLSEMALPAGDPHMKAFLLLQAHFGRNGLPVADYENDKTTVLDSSMRIMQSYIDLASELGLLSATATMISLLQSIKQARWPSSNIIEILLGSEIAGFVKSKTPTFSEIAKVIRNSGLATKDEKMASVVIAP